MPSFTVSVWTSLVLVVLMALRAITEILLPVSNPMLAYNEFLVIPLWPPLLRCNCNFHLWS